MPSPPASCWKEQWKGSGNAVRQSAYQEPSCESLLGFSPHGPLTRSPVALDL